MVAVNSSDAIAKMASAEGVAKTFADRDKLERLKEYVCEASTLEEFLARLDMVRTDELEKRAEAEETYE
jgi:hypothetical protein